MKIKSLINKVLLIGLLLPLLLNCKKEPIITVPSVTINAMTNITESSASSGGEVTSDGGSIINYRGLCWSTKEDPHLWDSKTSDGKGTGNFTSSLALLSPGTTYYIKAYAVNVKGPGYSNQSTFTTKAMAPVVTTIAPTAILFTTMSSGGAITTDGGAPITARGVCWATTENPTIANSKTTDGTGTGSFTSSITGLAANTTFYIRAYATNSAGTGYGNQLTAKTRSDVPDLSTSSVAATQTTATSGGNITFEGGSAITARGVCWSTGHNPTIADSKTTNGIGVGSFASSITGLTANTAYYLRAYATNSTQTGYGNEISFKTILLSQAADVDGNVYNTVRIGEQVWLVENLKTTKYRNGDPIAHATDKAAWAALTNNGAYCSPNGDASNDAAYGFLYNWFAVNDSRNIAPAGYHVATHADWNKLLNYLGNANVAGRAIKEAGTAHWLSPNDATNSSGFTARAAAFRNVDGEFLVWGKYAMFWTSTEAENDPSSAHFWYFTQESGMDTAAPPKERGNSVRCIMD